MSKDRINMSPDEPVTFTPEQVSEVIGSEVKSMDDFKTIWGEKTTPEKVVETKDYKFKDEYIKGVVDYYDKKGDVSAYIKNNVDYSKTEANDLIRMEIKKANEGLSEAAINHLTNQELKKYELAEDASDDDKNLQAELLKVRADKTRTFLTEEQKKFNAPEKPSVDIEKWANTINESDVTKGLVTDKKLEFKHGDTSFNLELSDPKSLVDMTIDNTPFFKLFANEDGSSNLDKWYRVIAYAQDPTAFEDSLIKHGQSIGTESVVKDLQNEKLGRKPNNPEGAGGLLQAFADKGRTK